MSHIRPRSVTGFTLTELAVVMAIIALLIGGLMMPLTAQRDVKSMNDANTALNEIREALLGFAVSNGRLPCPDSDQDGLENFSSITTNDSPQPGQSTQTFSVCAIAEGDLPYATLGTPQLDPWGHRFRYRVTPAFTQGTVVWSANNATGNRISVTPGFTLTSVGDITIKTRGDDPSTPLPTMETKFLQSLATNLPAVVISHGKNGYGAHDMDGNALPSPPNTNTDEVTNATAGVVKVSRLATAIPSGGCNDSAENLPSCEFDDIVTWLPPYTLFNRLVAAGKLP